jgi:hypothetical protein
MDVDGQDPFALEKDFSNIEGATKTVIDHIVANKTLPDTKGMADLLSFVGLLAVRTPGFRNQISDFSEEIGKGILNLVAADKDRFEKYRARMRAAGLNGHDHVTYEEFVEFLKKDQFTIETGQNVQLDLMLRSAAHITDLLVVRTWSIVTPKEGHFVTSDNPVGLMWTIPMGTGWYPPGFGLSGTQVTVPLTKKVGIVGMFEKMSGSVIALDEKSVATFNNGTLARAERFVYSPSENFHWRDQTGTIRDSKTFFEE